MPSIKSVAHYTQIDVDRVDGGLNVKDSPSKIGIRESPDCYNVVYGDRGSVKTREGTTYLNESSVVGSYIGRGLTQYGGNLVGWWNGALYNVVASSPTIVSNSTGVFDASRAISYVEYQNILFMSDGTNIPYRYEGSNSFYKMQVPVASALNGTSAGAGDIAAGTYYYRVSFVNSHAVEGEMGSAAAVTLTSSATVLFLNVPIGSGVDGVASRRIYRSNSGISGVYKRIQEITDNTTTTSGDSTGVGSEGVDGIEDISSITPFSSIAVHKDRLFFPDANNEAVLRWTEYGNPFGSKAGNFYPLNEGDGSDIIACAVQEDLLTPLKSNSIWLTELVDPTDDTTWLFRKSPANEGIAGPRAWCEHDNGLIYWAKVNGRVTGVHFLAGLQPQDLSDAFVRTREISERIEKKILELPQSVLDDVACIKLDNKIYMATPDSSGSTSNDGIWWFDTGRLGNAGNEGQPGSWAPWNGVVGVNDFSTLEGVLYGISSLDDGKILRFNNGSFTDADGSGIDSYWESKQLGGEEAIEHFHKDFRFLVVWYELLGVWDVQATVRVDGDSGTGTGYPISMNPGGSIWDSSEWDIDEWDGNQENEYKVLKISPLRGRRITVRFDNYGIAGRGFQVHQFKVLFNLRSQRRF